MRLAITGTAERRMLSEEGAAIARLAGPLIVAQVSQVGMAFTDTVMAGRLGATDLAAIALGSSLWLPIYLVCVGVLLALSPLVAQLRGASRLLEIGALFRQALWLALGISVIVFPLTRAAGALLPALGVDAQVAMVSEAYLDAIAWGMPATCVFLVLRFLSDGMGYTAPVMCVQLIALVANAAGNYVLMFGKLGAPAMGAEGAGWSSAIVLTLSLLLMAPYVAASPRYRGLSLMRHLDAPSFGAIWRLLRLGIPIALGLLAEVGFFSAVSLAMGTLGAVAVAAHQVAINFAALAFMVPLGISMAITIRVGHAAGSDDWRRARVSGLAGMAMGVLVMGLSALSMLLFPGQIVSLYSSDPQVAALAVSLLMLAAVFQVSDGLQITALGALRGLKDAAMPLAISLVAYWVVGFPLAYVLAITLGRGPLGLWMGLIVGLTIAAGLLSWRFHAKSRIGARHP